MNAADLQKLLNEATPGPWDVALSRSGRPYQIVAPNADNGAPGYVGKAVTRWASISLPSSVEADANARLIALAPDLARRVIAAEKLAEALKMADSALAGANMDMKAVWRKTQAALAEWDATQ